MGRAIQPTPASCDGATVSGTTVTPDVPCTYPAGSFGELAGNITGLLATEKNNTTPFTLENDTAPEFYVTGKPAPDAPQVRKLEQDVGSLTAANPYTGTTQDITNYLANPTEEAILHIVNADPARTPTFAMFARPDYFLSTGSATCSGSCVTLSARRSRTTVPAAEPADHRLPGHHQRRRAPARRILRLINGTGPAGAHPRPGPTLSW